MDACDEVAQHRFGNLEVCDDSVLHRTDRDDMARSPAQHLLRRFADSPHLVGASAVLGNSHHAWFGEDDATALHVDKCVRRSQIDSKVTRKPAEYRIEYHAGISLRSYLPMSPEPSTTRTSGITPASKFESPTVKILPKLLD